VTAVLYLALAVATIAVLGPAAGTDVPLASLLARAVGTAGPVAAAVAAVVLTLGGVNAYLSGAAAMARQLAGGGRGAGNRPILAASALAGLVVIGLYAAHLVGTAQLIGLPTTLFLVVYLGCTMSAARILHGKVRAAAVTAALAVLVVLAFCGWPLVLAALVAAAAALTGPRKQRVPRRQPNGEAPQIMGGAGPGVRSRSVLLAVAGPLGVERAVLVGPAVGVGPEVVAQALDECGGQAPGPQAVVVGQRRGEGG
jgi:amino acid efflux transporter